jgi:polyisoprenoid-binding protein YceI
VSTSTLTAPAGVTAWKVDPTHTHVGFAVRHLMISKVRGHFGEVEGTLRMEGDDLATARLDVEIRADCIETGVAQRDEHLRSADFLDAERFPSLAFRSTSFTRAGKDRLQVAGDLTIRDVTRPVVLDVVERGSVEDPWGGRRAGYQATTKIDRKDFGLTWNQALEAGGVLVGDEVEITLEGELLLES